MEKYLVQFKDDQGNVIYEEIVYSDFPVGDEGNDVVWSSTVHMAEAAKLYGELLDAKEMD